MQSTALAWVSGDWPRADEKERNYIVHIGKMSRFVIDALGLFNNRARKCPYWERFKKLNNVSFAFSIYTLVKMVISAPLPK